MRSKIPKKITQNLQLQSQLKKIIPNKIILIPHHLLQNQMKGMILDGEIQIKGIISREIIQEDQDLHYLKGIMKEVQDL